MTAWAALLMVAMAQGASSQPTHDLMATKFALGAILDLTNVHADPSNATTTCGQVQVNRHFSPIKFIADTHSGMVWLESLPQNDGGVSPIRDKVAALIIGDRPVLQAAWRRCSSGGAALSAG